MPDLSGLGDLVLTVGGDITPLTSALDEIPAAAQQAASQIQAAFDALPSATEGVNASLANLSTGLSEAGTQASAAGEQLSLLGDDVKALESSAQGNLFSEWSNGLQEVGGAANEAAGHIEQMPPALHDTAGAAHEAESSFGEFIKTSLELAGIVISLEALKEATLGSLEAFGELQNAQVALAAITKNATGAKEALEGIPALADQIGVGIASLETASVKFARFGVDMEQMPGLFSRIADAAKGSLQSFDSVASAWERIDLTGKIAAKTLMATGLTAQDLAKALGLELGASIKEISAKMEELGSGAARAAVLMKAVPESVQGLAESADTVTKTFTQMSNAITLAKEHIGEAIAGMGQDGGMAVLKNVIKEIETFIVAMIGYATQAIDVISGLATIAATEFVAMGRAASDAAHGNFKEAWAEITDGAKQVGLDMKAMTDKMASDWDKNGKIIDGIWSDTAAKINTNSAAIGDGVAAAKDKLEVLTEAVKTQKTAVDAVNDAYLKGAASASQLQTAISGMANAERALNEATKDHLYTFGSVIKYFDDYRQTLITNQKWLNDVTEAYANGVATLGQYERALKAVKSATDELNGGQTAAAKVSEEFEKLNLNLSKAQDYLAAVTDAMAKGQATAGMYQSAVSAVNTAQAALTGSTQTATAAISSSAPKIIEVTNTLNQHVVAVNTAASALAGFVGPVQQANSAVQVLKGSVSTLTDTFDAAKVTIIGAGNAFSQTAADLVSYVNEAANATTATDNLTQAIETAASAAESLGSQLDRTMATASEGGGRLGMSVGLKPGDQYTALTANTIAGVNYGGTETGSMVGGGLFGPTGPGETMTFDPAAYAKQLQQTNTALNNAATNLNTAGTALTTAATAQQTAAWAAADAAKMQQAVTVGMVGATNSLNSTALRAADAANQQAMNNMGFASVVTLAGAVMTGTAQALALSSSTLVSAASVIAQVAQKAGVQFSSTTFGQTLGSQLSLPNVGTGSGQLSYGSGGMPFAQPYFSSGPQSNVTVSVNGSQFVQSLMNEFVRNLQTQGIRLTRG